MVEAFNSVHKFFKLCVAGPISCLLLVLSMGYPDPFSPNKSLENDRFFYFHPTRQKYQIAIFSLVYIFGHHFSPLWEKFC